MAGLVPITEHRTCRHCGDPITRTRNDWKHASGRWTCSAGNRFAELLPEEAERMYTVTVVKRDTPRFQVEFEQVIDAPDWQTALVAATTDVFKEFYRTKRRRRTS